MGTDEIHGLELWMCSLLAVQEVARRYVTVPASTSTLAALSLSSRSLLAANIYRTYEYSSHTISLLTEPAPQHLSFLKQTVISLTPRHLQPLLSVQ